MARRYTKVEHIAEAVMNRKACGETNRQIGESLGLSQKQIKQLVTRQNKKAQLLIQQGHMFRPKGRPRKTEATQEQKQACEMMKLKMEVELLRNFLCAAGRR